MAKIREVSVIAGLAGLLVEGIVWLVYGIVALLPYGSPGPASEFAVVANIAIALGIVLAIGLVFLVDRL